MTAKFGRGSIEMLKRPNCDYLASENYEWSALLHNDAGTKYERRALKIFIIVHIGV